MKSRIIKIPAITAVLVPLLACVSIAENIDPYEDGSQFAYGENIGWLNFEPNVPGDPCDYGVTVSDTELTGFVWAENIGWISMSCENTSSCGTVNYGVTNDGSGNLSGYAWAENVGWISFSCGNTSSCGTVDYGVTIDSDGNFDGFAWAENIGWIHFQSAGSVAYKVQTCKVNLEDFANFALYWLDSGGGLPADLDNLGDVNIDDLNVFAIYWLGFCPDGWQLK
jgi:hypothetical protein